MNGSFQKKGIMNWKMPSAGQTALLVLIFGLPIGLGVLFIDKMPPGFAKVFFIGWFTIATVAYIYILSHGKGSEKSTVVDTDGLSGEFSIDNSFLAFSSIYFFAGSAGAFINKYYIVGAFLFIAGLGVIYAAKYIRKKLLFDSSGNMYILQNGNEILCDFSRLKYAECRKNELTSENVYRPRIKLIFTSLTGENSEIKLKLNVLRSLDYGTYSDPRLIIYYIKDKCLAQNMIINYIDNDESDFDASRI